MSNSKYDDKMYVWPKATKERAQELAMRSPAVTDTRGNPTGWHIYDLDNYSLLLRADGGQVIEFRNPNPRSGTEALRTRMIARHYAVDYPFQGNQPKEIPIQTEGTEHLIVQPLYAKV